MPPIRSIFEPDARADLLTRIGNLRPETPGRWGRMTVDAMVVHLAEGYRFALEATLRERKDPRGLARAKAGIMRFAALRLPVPWPRGAPTLEGLRVDGSLRPAGEFAAEIRTLRELIDRFARVSPDRTWPPHPIWGTISMEDWGRWAWRHADHHLRQFGA